MWGLTQKLIPILLAANPYTPQSINEVVHDFREFYNTLGAESTTGVYKEASSTVKFFYVTPPSSNGESHKETDDEVLSWRDKIVLESDSYLMEENKNNDDDNDNDNNNGSSSNGIHHAVAKKYGTEKPIALYMPGMDGSGISAAGFQFDDLSQTFELWRMAMTISDRSSFSELVRYASDFCDELTNTAQGNQHRPIYLIAESFSGLLAPAVALQLQNRERRSGGRKSPIHGLVMVNPATSFDKSIWDVAGPLLVTLDRLTNNNDNNNSRGKLQNENDTPAGLPFRFPTPYAVVGGMTISALTTSNKQFQQIVDTFLQIPSPISLPGSSRGVSDGTTNSNPREQVLEALEGYRDMFDLIAKRLPSDLVEHRLNKWMMVGHSLVNPRLSQLEVPTLIVVGNDDRLLGSAKEANRLEQVIPNTEILAVDNSGHFVLDETVNLTEAMIYSKIMDPLNFKTTKKAYDPILDWTLPSKEVIATTREKVVEPLEQAFSPIYLSTNSQGERAMGIHNLPKGGGENGPLLFVSNHQLLGLDLNLLVPELLKEDIVVRGLAHPVLFAGSTLDELGGRQPGLNPTDTPSRGPGNSPRQFRQFGAVQVSPRNYYRLMQTGQNALLFPGGTREVFHGRNEAHQLFWPEKVDFVRTAARFNATIIPLSAVGMADSGIMLLESSEVAQIPVLGDRAKQFAANVTAARFDKTNGEESFLPPIVAPSLPSRNYFIFGKPVSTKDLDPKDKEACQKVYLELQEEITRGFDDILHAREKDPYKDAPQRLAYERFTGKKAPTFDLKEVNR